MSLLFPKILLMTTERLKALWNYFLFTPLLLIQRQKRNWNKHPLCNYGISPFLPPLPSMSTVIITWWSEWLWYELAKVFLEKGVEVVCLCRKKPDLDVVHIPTDLSDEESIAHAVTLIKTHYATFSTLINCAWVLHVEELDAIDYKELQHLFRVNVLAPIMLTSSLLPEIKANEADIVNVGSTVWFKAYEKQCAYGSSKWAVRWFNENLQLELKKTKCRVIGFNPWGFKSTLFEKATWTPVDLSPYMEPKELAKFMMHILDLPKNMEVSEVVVNRK